jgi:hypothetical protein
MFNPAFIYILEENENENENAMINQDLLLSKNFIEFLLVVSISIATFRLLQVPRFINYLANVIWNSLSPDQQWLELTAILFSIVSTASILVLLAKLANELDAKMTRMIKSLEEKEKQIAELEAILEKQNL